MPPVIIGLSGRKHAGKSTLAKFLVANAGVLFGQKPDPVYRFHNDREYLRDADACDYSLAGPLKEFCVDVLGLTRDQCYGSETDKNSFTRYKWEDLPHYPEIVGRLLRQCEEEVVRETTLAHRLFLRLVGLYQQAISNRLAMKAPTGFMTVREVLQEVGTGIFRRMYADVWNEACLREIRATNPDVAIIDDVRFPDEADAVKRAGGVVVRLTRTGDEPDGHASETAMDGYRGFSVVLDNENMGREESCVELCNALHKLGVVRCGVYDGHSRTAVDCVTEDSLVFPGGESC